MKILFSSFLLFFVLISGISQIIETTIVPFNVKRAFAEGFPSITSVVWSVNNNYYNGTFEVDQLKKIVTYDEFGTYIESKAGLLLSELPLTIQDYINLHGTNDFQKEYYRVLKADGTESYEIILNEMNITFNAVGGLTKASTIKGKI